VSQDPTRIGFSSQFDKDLTSQIKELMLESNLPLDELMELWPLFTRRVHFLKAIALIEVFKKTIELPGSIVECGVFKGQSLGLFCKLLETFCPGDSLKKLIGFDTFEGFVSLHKKDGPADESRAKTVGGWNSIDFLPTLQKSIALMQDDSYLPRLKRIELIKGDVRETIPRFVQENPGFRISLLNLDLDLYEPTKTALEFLFPLVVPGGIVILDEYAMQGFPGESRAFEDYFEGRAPILKKFPFTPTPGGYFVKNM
jgi:hypothetical protein